MAKKVGMEMFINAREGDEIRVAVLNNNILEEYFAERGSNTKARKGDIFIGKVSNVDRGMQAAFIDIGEGPHGFLSLSDIRYPDGGFGELLRGKQKRKLTGDIDISKVLRKGQKIVVQVTRETIGHKGPSLTTYASIPGRFIVIIPEAPDKAGISRKIEDEKERKRLRVMWKKIKSPKEHGFIFRTASFGCNHNDIVNDLKYLSGMWEDMAKKIKNRTAPTPRCIYRENDLILRVFRDIYSEKIKKVFVDSREAFDKIVSFLKGIMPKKVRSLQLTETREPLFDKYNIESQIENIVAREVPLSNGGSIVIEQTEAMVSIDVNSGNFQEKKGQEQMALKTNLLAADEIARQMRFRNMGGLVCIDFIDMRQARNRQQIEKQLADAVKSDKARISMLKISDFGILEMTRQRDRQNVINVNFAKCPVCKGRGFIKSHETMVISIFRHLKQMIAKSRNRKNKSRKFNVKVHPDLAGYLLNENRRRLISFEEEHKVSININTSNDISISDVIYK